MLELNSKEHTLRGLAHAHELSELLAGLNPPENPKMFSAFKDQQGFSGCVPTGAFFKNLIEEVGEDLSPYFDKEVKKRGALMLFGDVSYKEAKYLAKYHR